MHEDLKFVTGVSSGGRGQCRIPCSISVTAFENLSDRPVDFEFYLLIRPFQVNPYYQFLKQSEEAGG